MKVYYTKWESLCNTRRDVMMAQIKEEIKKAKSYNRSHEKMDLQIQNRFTRIIKILEYIGVFEFEGNESWRERLFVFYEFCDKVA